DVIHPPRHHPRERALLSGENVIPTFVAPAEAGVQTSARMALCVLAWIPGLRRDDNVVEFRQTRSARWFAILRANHVSPCDAGGCSGGITPFCARKKRTECAWRAPTN